MILVAIIQNNIIKIILGNISLNDKDLLFCISIFLYIFIFSAHACVLQYDYEDVNVFYPHANAYDMTF